MGYRIDSVNIRHQVRVPRSIVSVSLLGDANRSNRRLQQVIVEASSAQGMCKGLLVAFAHEVAEELVVQVALHVEESCQ